MLLCFAVLVAYDQGCAAVTLRCGPDLYAHDMRPGASARRAGELPPRQLANIVHGFAAMRHHPGDALLVACAAQAAERFSEANPQELSNTLWGFAKVSFLVHLMLLAAMPLPGWILSSRRNLNVCMRCRSCNSTRAMRCCEPPRLQLYCVLKSSSRNMWCVHSSNDACLCVLSRKQTLFC